MSEESLRRWMEANRLNWDDRTAIHLRNGTGFYAIDRVKAGDEKFRGCEDAELGEVAGKRLIHLQCHFGLDTIRLARRGTIATGLDFSAPAIAAARAGRRTRRRRVLCRGECLRRPGSAYWRKLRHGLCHLGAIIWLPDTRRWAKIVAGLLAPGGWLYLAEGHPSTLSLEEVDGRLVASGSWRTRPTSPFVYDEPATYTGDPTPLAHTRSYEWCHPLSEIIGALLERGLRLDFLHEHETLPWRHFPMMVPAGERLYRLPDSHPTLPLAFSLGASKPG